MCQMRLLACLLTTLVIAQTADATDKASTARPDCSKYQAFLEAWTAGNTSSEFDPRRLNTEDLKGCTEPDTPHRQLAASRRARMSFNGPGADTVSYGND